jgi:hypothetical protein
MDWLPVTLRIANRDNIIGRLDISTNDTIVPNGKLINSLVLSRPNQHHRKRGKLKKIEAGKYLSACNHCSGDPGTADLHKRHKATEQIKG